MPKKTKHHAAKPAWSPSDKARIERLVLKWRGLLLLSGYDITARFKNEASADGNTAAEVTTNYPYRCGYVIDFYPCFVDSALAEQERRVIHELVHFITIPMKAAAHDLVSEKLVLWRDIKDRDETMVDWIATILHLRGTKWPA